MNGMNVAAILNRGIPNRTMTHIMHSFYKDHFFFIYYFNLANSVEFLFEKWKNISM